MKVNRAAFEQRHAAIVRRAEKQFLAQKKLTPKYGTRQAILSYAVAIRAAIARRDNTGIAACHAAASAHIAMLFARQKKGSKHPTVIGTLSPTGLKPTLLPTGNKPPSLPLFRPHDLGA